METCAIQKPAEQINPLTDRHEILPTPIWLRQYKIDEND